MPILPADPGPMLMGRKVLVTGGSRGIGAATVRMCCALGAFTGFTYFRSEEEAAALQKALGKGVCASYRSDVRDLSSLERVASDLSSRGRTTGLDGLVVNAGTYRRASFRELSEASWRETMATNLDGAYNTVKAALPHMERGSMVIVSSQLALKGSRNGPDYAASKSGLLGLARSLARELAPDIRVNTVSPGYIDTDILSGDSPSKRTERVSEVPLGRIGTPEDIGKVIAFLLSDMSSYITGADVDVNGGLFIH